jgi:hypothetical protein
MHARVRIINPWSSLTTPGIPAHACRGLDNHDFAERYGPAIAPRPSIALSALPGDKRNISNLVRLQGLK